MRTQSWFVILAWLTLYGTAGAQAPVATPAQLPAPAPISSSANQVDFGVRFNSLSGDPARFQRFRDLRDGATLDRLRYDRDTQTWDFRAEVDHAGYRDQRFWGRFTQYGKVKASFEWNQVPLFISADTRTPFRSVADGVFRLDDALQASVQSGAATITAFNSQVRPFELRSRRDVADARLTYAATRNLDLRVSFTSTRRKGEQPMGASFGQSLSVELPAPIDHRTNDVNTTAEWSTDRAMVRLAYDGSWFTNHIESLIFDNPLRITDQISAGVDGPSQGRIALWPDSTAHTVSAAASTALPARTRAFAYVSVGTWLQDQKLLPFTINTAIPTIPLPRDSADAEARIISMNYRVTSRPTSMLWLNGQYRVYDYDNRTPHFAVDQYVRVDQTVATSATGGSEPFGYIRHFVDLDASLTPFRFTAFRLGYGREDDDRTFRFLDKTVENTLRASIDSTGLTWGSLRLLYDRAVRTGKGLDEEAFSEIGEQVSLRQFDISDRTRDRVTAIVQVAPIASLGLYASTALGQEHRPDAAFGLQDNDMKTITVGFDATPSNAIQAGASYSFENYTTLQRSRQANPGVQFDDPTRDWSTDMNEDVHTVTGNVDLPRLTERTALHVGYDFVRSNARYLYVLTPNSTLPPPSQLPPVINRIQRAGADLQYTLRQGVLLAIGYAYDAYQVEDFALSPGTLNSPIFSTFVDLMYQYRPYRAHTGSVRLIYRW